jgi:hypothetical protein
MRLAGLEPLTIGDDALFVNVGERTNVTPPRSNVPDATTGSRRPVAAKYFSIAKRHAFRFSVSITVSGSRMSTPASTSAFTCA